MARVLDRQNAINLRKQGKTYSEIRQELGISKSTLSDWLSDLPLNKEQMAKLNETKSKSRLLAIEKTRITKKQKREKRLQLIYNTEKQYWILLTKRELELAGLCLYWGEGTKLINGPISINNTDPGVMKFVLHWMIKGLGISKKSIKVRLQLYNDMNIKKEINYWHRELKIPLSQFAKPYVKKSLRINIDHKGFGHGTCGLLTSNILLKEKIMMAIRAISESCKD